RLQSSVFYPSQATPAVMILVLIYDDALNHAGRFRTAVINLNLRTGSDHRFLDLGAGPIDKTHGLAQRIADRFGYAFFANHNDLTGRERGYRSVGVGRCSFSGRRARSRRRRGGRLV